MKYKKDFTVAQWKTPEPAKPPTAEDLCFFCKVPLWIVQQIQEQKTVKETRR